MKTQTDERIIAEPEKSLHDEGTRKMARATVAAVIVLYRPDLALLDRLARSIARQVDKVFVIDNTPGAGGDKPASFDDCLQPVSYHANGFNMGLAGGQNAGIRRAVYEGYTHVLLLDQDSALPETALEGLLAAERTLLQAGCQVAAVGPLFIDEKNGQRCGAVRHSWLHMRWSPIPDHATEPVETDYLIGSGSLIRSSILTKVGLMREELFIDWVDAEWAYRARSMGYLSYIAPTVVMKHSVGDATGRFLGKSFNLHSPARNYYIVRNAIYLTREPRMSWRWRLTMPIYVPKYILVHSWLSKRRIRSLWQMARAVWEGVAGTMRPFTEQ